MYEDLISSGALKVQEVVRHSPAEAGGLRKNDVIVEINKENIELKSFFPLVEILKEAFAENEMELLVLAEQDAQWYRLRNITVNNNFPNIEYCETPYYGHILKPLDSMAQQGKLGNSQIEFHSSTGKLFRTTLVIDNERESVYRRVEELPSNAPAQSADQSIPPLRPDGTFRHPGADAGSVRVYYRRDQSCRLAKGDEAMADSGVGTIKERRSTPSNLNNTTTSPFSTMGKSNAEIAVDLLHDKWADLMDEYLDDKFRSGPREDKYERPDRDSSAKKSHVIRLNDPSSTMRSKSRSKSRCQSPNDASFSFLYSGRDDFQTTSATSFRDFNQRQQSPFQNTLNRGSPHTQSHNRFTSPHHTLQSPIKQKYPIQVASAGHKSRPSQVTSPIHHTVENQTITSYQYDSSSYTAASAKYHPTNQYSYQEQSYSSNYTRDPASPTGAEKAYTFNKNYSSDGSSLTKPSLIQHEYSSSSSNQLGFQLDENEIRTKGVYYVKSVEANSPSAMAGLKQGDKITKINGKSTSGMSYDQFCDEIVIAQQQQLKNNMIHLMVMRKSAKSSAIGSYSSISKSGTTVLPIKNYKSSSFVDEGYGPDSATSSTTTTAAISSSSNKNLISYVKVTSPDGKTPLNTNHTLTNRLTNF
ncbi:Na(+) H(+) exchange regulatory cofactor NHE-RF1 [Brachionus plicatilis]|uniref:Na(+) H(+) exchange regulatory cofactor NHE-RF1 n=1 Tax=Brachionus plicatilis TaxID=10195 RepID=A0A3M7R069_BRAPC|nr:Na(+) H(+) exchange regulatory cofactor NHE-RF1 [Brachionus plicatilis]